VIRTLLLCAASLVGACSATPSRCDLSVTRDVSFTSAEAAETITVRAFGPSCDHAVGLYEIRTEDGVPIWAWSAPLPRAFGDVFPPREREAMQDFLERWAQPKLFPASAAPAWEDLEPGLTSLDQLTYEDIRARDLPTLCHASSTGRETCIFWEPAAGGAGHFYDREAESS
jgi:hypothetical protein